MTKHRKAHVHLYSCLGKVIQDRRKKLNLSQEELAKEADVNRPFLSNVEHGKRNPSIGALTNIAEGLKIKVSRLMGMCEECIRLQEEEPGA